MKNKDRIIILYHSGAGSTKALAEIYYNQLGTYNVDICSISMAYHYNMLAEYDYYIFAFPTYHCEPSLSMVEFIKRMPKFNDIRKGFAFTTCGLYSGNTLRIFIKECLKKNIHIGQSWGYRAPATDGVLFFPKRKMMLEYEKNIGKRIIEDVKNLKLIIEKNTHKMNVPKFKMYTLLNFPNKLLGKVYKHKLRIHKEFCLNCNICVNSCIRGSWKANNQYPNYSNDNCEFCFKCIHHCPNNAIIISKKTLKKTKLNSKFYNEQKAKISFEIECVINDPIHDI